MNCWKLIFPSGCPIFMWGFLITQEERSQVVLPFLYSRERAAAVFSGIGWVSFFSPQIISGASVFVGDGSVGSCCFIPAKGCELPVIPLGGMWILGDFLALKMPMSLQQFTYGLTVGLGHCLLRLYMWSSWLRSAGKHGGGRRATAAARRREDGR